MGDKIESGDDQWVELRESGGFVGRPLRYRARLDDLPESMRELVKRLPEAPAPTAASAFNLRGADVAHTEFLSERGGQMEPLDTSAVDADLLEMFAGELRAFPVRMTASRRGPDSGAVAQPSQPSDHPSGPAAATPKIAALFFDLGETLVTGAPPSWVPGARALLNELKSRGVPLGVLSNTGSMDRASLASQLPSDFSFGDFAPNLVVLSSEVGMEKPDPRIFREAIRRAGTAGDSLFCTEDAAHALAAQLAGMRSLRVMPPPNSDVGDILAVMVNAGLLART